jgi:hypothetical protein
MNGHGYKVGDRVRIVAAGDDGADDPAIGSVHCVISVDSTDIPVKIDHNDGWWVKLRMIEPVDSGPRLDGETPHPTGEAMGLAHAKAWRLFTAKTPRERLNASGWALVTDRSHHESVEAWRDTSGILVEVGRGDVYVANFDPAVESAGLSVAELRHFADIAESLAVTP